MKVYVRAPIHADAVTFLRADPRIQTVLWDDAGADDWQNEADAVILRGLDITGDEIRRCKKLKVIGRHGAGVDSVDLIAAREKNIIVLNTPYENSQSVAELTVGFMIAAARNMYKTANSVRNGNWAEGRKGQGCIELFEHTAGFVGFGRIACMVANILRNSFAMQIYAYDPYLTEEHWAKSYDYVTPCATLEHLFRTCDYVSIHVPKTATTQNMINEDVFAVARKGLVLVNTARGGVVDEEALYGALMNGTVRAAASDVFSIEPIDPSHKLLTLDNFIATPHYGGATTDCLRRVAMAISREVINHLHGEFNNEYRVM